MYRTHNLGELNIKNAGEEVELSGWVQKIRDLGAMTFIDLRDEFGITQIVINNENIKEKAKEIKAESCIHINGKVVERASKNNKIPTGEIEVVAEKIEISVRYVSDIEQDRAKPSYEVLIKMCNLFKISLDQIFSKYLDVTNNKTLEYPLSGYDKLSKEDKQTIEHLIMYFNKSKEEK